MRSYFKLQLSILFVSQVTSKSSGKLSPYICIKLLTGTQTEKMDCNTQIQIPRLLQLSAERVASMVNRHKKTRRYLKVLENINMPKIDITYIDYTEDDYDEFLFYGTCDFSEYIKKKHWEPTIVPSVPKCCENYKFTITIGTEKVLYISTLTDLGTDMLKLDFPVGEYELFPFDEGYVLRTKEYTPNIQDAIHIFNTRDDDKGLGGTYHDREIKNVNLLRLFNRFISQYISEERWGKIRYDRPYRAVLDCLAGYNNIPVLFYLTEDININDLSKIILTCASEINNCGNVEVCWYVQHAEKGRIGIAVKQTDFFDMMFDQAGIGLFALNGFRAIGNFQTYCTYPLPDNVNEMIFEHHHYYECEFNPCTCDFSYNSTIERQYLSGMLSPRTRDRVREERIARFAKIRANYSRDD